VAAWPIPLQSDPERKGREMPTNYVEDYDGEKSDDAVEPVTLAPVFDHSADSKRLEVESVEDKAVKRPAKKSAKK
jgi:hypothetical protein